VLHLSALVRIRRAGRRDVGEIARLYIALKNHHAPLQPDSPRYQVEDARWQQTAREALWDQKFVCYVGERDGRTVAFMKLHFVEKVGGTSCEIDTLVVEEGARGHGVGRSLIAAAEEEAIKRGAGNMRVDVLIANRRGVAFYEREGYEAFALRLGKSLNRRG
jgi:GNAT superfamily N-acetyltransferase